MFLDSTAKKFVISPFFLFFQNKNGNEIHRRQTILFELLRDNNAKYEMDQGKLIDL